MLRKQRKVSLVMAVVLAFIFFGVSVAAAKTIELNLSLFIPQRHNRYLTVIKPWIDMVEKRTNGQVKITPFFTMALAPLPEFFDATVKGIADISEGVSNYTVGRFPLTETIMLPELGLNTSLSCSRALWSVYKKFPAVQKEWAGAKMLWQHVSPPMHIGTTKKPINKLEDLQGLKIWVTGSTAVNAGKALGFSPVTMPPGDVYLALQKGVIDGAAADNEIAESRKFDEVLKYIVDIELAHVNFFVVMNQRVYDRLPADVKKVFDELSGDYMVDFTGKIRDEKEQESEKAIKAKGVQYISLSPAEKARAKELMAPVKKAYAGELDKKGLPGTEVLKAIEAFAAK